MWESGTTSFKPTASSFKRDNRWLAACSLQLAAAASGFLLPLQTVWIFRQGMLGSVPWPLATIGAYASDVVLFVAAVIGLVRVWRGYHPPTPPAREFEISNFKFGERGWGSRRHALAALTLLVVVAIVNTLMSADPWLSAVGWLRIIAFLLALIGIPSWPTSARRAFLGGFLIVMLGHVIIGLIQFFTLEAQSSTLLGIAAHNAWTLGDSVITAPGERWLRAYGGFPHPNVLGTALLVALIAVAAAGQQGKAAAGQGGSRAAGRQILLTSYFLLLTFALVLSFSRAAWLGFVVLLIVMAWRRGAPEKDGRLKLEQVGDVDASRWSVRSLAGIGTLAFAVFLLVLWPLIVPRFTGSTPNEQRSLSERSHSLEAAIAFGSVPPFLGIGLHAMPQVLWEFRPYLREHTVTPWSWAQPAHNVPLLALAEIGPIGVFILVLVLVMLWRHIKKSAFCILHFAFTIPFVPPLLFDHHLWSLPIGLALVFVLAVAMSRVEELPPSTAA